MMIIGWIYSGSNITWNFPKLQSKPLQDVINMLRYYVSMKYEYNLYHFHDMDDSSCTILHIWDVCHAGTINLCTVGTRFRVSGMWFGEFMDRRKPVLITTQEARHRNLTRANYILQAHTGTMHETYSICSHIYFPENWKHAQFKVFYNIPRAKAVLL